MNNKNIIILISILISSLFYNCTENKEEQLAKVDLGCTIIKMKSSLPDYTYNIFSKEDSLKIYYDSILVIDTNNHVLQNISLNDKDEWGRLFSNKSDGVPIYFKDYNFDGFEDLIIGRQVSAMANVFCSFWLYSKKEKKFIYNDQLSSLISVSVDSLNQEIISCYKPGFNEFTEEKYKWVNNKLVQLK